METDPETLGVMVEGHLQRAVLMGHRQTTGKVATELGEGCEKEPGGLPEAVGEGPRAFLLMGGRGKGYPQGGVMVGHRPLPWGTPRIT
jgi:hypothetical protein